jgi:imidazolonepropionase-like amidohydrolase
VIAAAAYRTDDSAKASMNTDAEDKRVRLNKRVRRLSIACAVVALCCVLPNSYGVRAQPRAGTLALTGGRVIATPEASTTDKTSVIVENGRIVAVGPRERVTIPEGARIIDCTGLTIVSGFQNSHVHFTDDQWSAAAEQPASKLTKQLQAMLTRYGFTTVVDAASLLSNTVALRKRVDSGEVSGPRIMTAGLALYPPNGVPYYVRDVVPPEVLALLLQPSTPRDAESMVRNNVDGGADVIKLFTGSNITRERVLPMPRDVAAAAVTEAHRLGKLAFAHPGNVAGLEVAIEARVDVLAHVVEGTSGFTRAHLERMKRGDMALVPTLKLLGEGDDRQVIRNEVRDYAQLGGQILFGTDVGYLPDYDPLREYQLMEAAGLTWRQVLASLTTNPASRFHASGHRGSVEPGMEGDLVVLGSDPSRDVGAFTDVRYAIKSGQVIYER